MKRENLIVLLLGLIIGVTGTFAWFTHTSRPATQTDNLPSIKPAVALTTDEEDLDWLKEAEEVGWNDPIYDEGQFQKLSDENAALRTQVEQLLEWIVQNLPKGKKPPLHNPDKLTVRSVLGEDGKLNQALTEKLKLTPAQKRNVNAALAYSRASIDMVRTNSMRPYQRGNAQLYVKVPAFKEEGEAIRNKLLVNLKQAMGPSTYKEFTSLTDEYLASAFNHFGKARQSISFKSYKEQKTGKTKIYITDRYMIEKEGGRNIIEIHRGSYSTLPPAYSNLIDWDPNP